MNIGLQRSLPIPPSAGNIWRTRHREIPILPHSFHEAVSVSRRVFPWFEFLKDTKTPAVKLPCRRDKEYSDMQAWIQSAGHAGKNRDGLSNPAESGKVYAIGIDHRI